MDSIERLEVMLDQSQAHDKAEFERIYARIDRLEDKVGWELRDLRHHVDVSLRWLIGLQVATLAGFAGVVLKHVL